MKHNLRTLLVFIALFSANLNSQTYNLLIGTYTNSGKSKGIYSYKLNLEKALFEQISVMKNVSNPSFLVITADKKYVYSVNESANESAANAFNFDKLNGELTFINREFTNGKSPCYISTNDKYIFTANYGGGSLSVFGRNTDGSLTQNIQLIQHNGKSVNTERQSESHIHQVLLAPDNKFVLATDLGADKVIVYKYNLAAKFKILVPFDSITLKLGSGPRHATFNGLGTKLYVVQELDGTISVLDFKDGHLSLQQETTLDIQQGTINRAADIHLSPDGNFLYVTNRGSANNITCFKVDNNGQLSFKQQISSGGKGPRNFAITFDGKYLIIANQFSDNLVILSRNIKTGLLVDTGKRIEIGEPVCLIFY